MSIDSAEQVVQVKVPRLRFKIGLLSIAGIFIALVIGYVVVYAMSDDIAPRNASVAGVPVGGMNAVEVREALETYLGGQVFAPIIMRGEAGPHELSPVDAGLGVNWTATVAKVGVKKSAHPRVIFNRVFGGGNTDPILTIDETKAAQTVSALGPKFTALVAEPKFEIKDGVLAYTPPVVGTSFDNSESTKRVIAEWSKAMKAKTRSAVIVEAKQELTQPRITKDKADVAANEVKTILMPVKVATARGEFTITPAQLGAAISVEQAESTLKVATNLEKLYGDSAEGIAAVSGQKPQDAKIVLSGGAPMIVPSKDGFTIAQDDFVKAVQPLLTKKEGRLAKIEVSTATPKFTTKDAEALGVKTVIGEFTTTFPHTDPPFRNINLGLVARAVNGTLLKPGEEFNFDKVVGRRNYSTGYVDGGVLINGRLEMAVGGGISQTATTLFNAAFFAGMKDIEHHPHQLYFSRYPMGREATLWEGSLNLRFQNVSKYGALVEAWMVPSSPGSEGSFTVRIWSTKTYDEIRSTTPHAYNHKPGGKREISDPRCIPQPPSSGFDVSYSRLFINGGQVVKKEDFWWRYSPADEIVCKKKETEPAPPPESQRPS